jgi:hypothetical protein
MIKRFPITVIIIFFNINSAEQSSVIGCNINQSPIQVAYQAYLKYSQKKRCIGLPKRIFYTSSSCPVYQQYVTEQAKLEHEEKERLKQMIADYEKSLK